LSHDNDEVHAEFFPKEAPAEVSEQLCPFLYIVVDCPRNNVGVVDLSALAVQLVNHVCGCMRRRKHSQTDRDAMRLALSNKCFSLMPLQSTSQH
jgi:hypothetical protein